MSGDALRKYNFALKKSEAYASKQIQGVALPQKERIRQALVCKLEKYMMQLVQIMHKVIEQTYEYQKKVQKSGENNIKM